MCNSFRFLQEILACTATFQLLWEIFVCEMHVPCSIDNNGARLSEPQSNYIYIYLQINMQSVCRVYAMLKVKLQCACICMCTIVYMLFTLPLTQSELIKDMQSVCNVNSEA